MEIKGFHVFHCVERSTSVNNSPASGKIEIIGNYVTDLFRREPEQVLSTASNGDLAIVVRP
jgi:hypothetical protein